MPTYISLMKVTDQGAKKAASAQMDEIMGCITRDGGRWTGMYTVIGEYDYVCIFEAPTDETALTWLQNVSSRGDVKTTTLKGFTKEELAKQPRR